MIQYSEELKDPYKVQSLISEHIRDKSNIEINDPNTPITILIDSISYLYSNMTNKIDNLENRLYVKNINTLNDIYKYLENEELPDLFGKPSKFNFFLLINLRDLIDKAEAVGINDEVIEIKIPKGMELTINDFDNILFSNYHELVLKINKVTLNHWLTYADSEIQIEPFLIKRDDTQLNSILIEHNTIKYLRITFPFYQFRRTVFEPVQRKITAPFTDQLMGMEFFKYTSIINGIYQNVEKINLVHEDANYDVNTLTGKFRYLNENEIEVSIPVIYRSNGLISENDKMRLLLYTTNGEKGNIEISIPEEDDISPVNIKFNLLQNQREHYDPYISLLGENNELNKYVIIDKNYRFTKGGEARKPFEIIKENAVHNYSKNKIPINENELRLYLKNKGYGLQVYKETITNKIYIAHKEMKLDNLILPTYNTLDIIIDPSDLTEIDDIPTIDDSNILHGVYKKNNIITITPDTIWEINREENTANILTRGALIENSTFSNTQTKLNELNHRNLMFFPFNININLDRLYPTCEVFNFNTPEIKNRKQTNKNLDISLNLLVESFRINKISYRNKDYFRLEFSIINENQNLTIDTVNLNEETVQKIINGDIKEYYNSEDFTSFNINELLPVLTFRNSQNEIVYKTGIFSNSYQEEGTELINYIFSIDLETNYITDILNEEQYINLKIKSNTTNILRDQFSKIMQDMNLTILYAKNIIDTINNLSLSHIPDIYNNYIQVIDFQFNIKFGEELTGYFGNDFNIIKKINLDNYERYSATEYSTLNADEYKKDSSGSLVCITDDNDNTVFTLDVFRNEDEDSFLVFDDISHISPSLASDATDVTVYDEINPRHIKLSNMLTEEDIVEDETSPTNKKIKDEIRLIYNKQTEGEEQVSNVITKGELQKRRGTYAFDGKGQKTILQEFGHQVLKDEIVRDPLSGAVLLSGRTETVLNDFQLNMYLFDYKLKYVDNDNLYKYIVNNTLLNINNLKEIRNHLLYRTSVFYNPTNTYGFNQYRINLDVDNIEYIDKNFKIDLNIHILEDTYSQSENINFIEKTVQNVIYKNINNKTLSVFDIITDLKTEISNEIILDINIKTLIRNRPGIYLLEKVNEEDVNYVNTILKEINGIVTLSPDISIEYTVV